MNNQSLDASRFSYNTVFYNTDFEDILKGIIACYHCIVIAKTPLPYNDENTIRDIMLTGYLKEPSFKSEHPPLINFLFDKETSELNGRADIRVLDRNQLMDDYAYYIIECKRLDNENQNGKTGLNGEYITNGIARFVLEEKYPFYISTAGMIGFIVSKMNIHQNVASINHLLNESFPEINTQESLTKKQIVPEFEYSYYSIHKVNDSSKIIYHLMFNFFDNTIAPKGKSA